MALTGERRPAEGEQPGVRRGDLPELAALHLEHLPVEQHAELFHALEHGYERLFDVLVQRLESRDRSLSTDRDVPKS